MINWKNFDAELEDDPLFYNKIINGLLADIKYERSRGLSKMKKKELRDIKEFRTIAKAINLFSESHPILEDDLNLLEEIKKIA